MNPGLPRRMDGTSNNASNNAHEVVVHSIDCVCFARDELQKAFFEACRVLLHRHGLTTSSVGTVIMSSSERDRGFVMGTSGGEIVRVVLVKSITFPSPLR